ncbi:hypothetical protein [Methylobacterium sp. J-068]|uniref:hypothetical protein n=1 Tax=Methylobacterium sp. J-068 TaxID=2836649 RepID=UPI001FB91C2F|nr:hypothetical protein [Methylobacterium sp. J-068]MCJ2032828.1 hypothetical protein [Methylobacterium sp. J-068]
MLALFVGSLPGLVLLGVARPALAKPAWTTGTFVYADLCTQPESGTRVGQRVILRRSPNGDGLTYEGAEQSGPLAAGDMTVDDATHAITFAVETGAGALHFEGVATPDALTGTFEDEAGAHPVHLPRVLRSHAHEACRGETTGSIDRRR